MKKFLSVFISVVLILVTLPIFGLFSASATADWDYYTIRDYTGNSAPSINDSNIFGWGSGGTADAPDREFVNQYTPDGTNWSLKLTSPANKNKNFYFKNIKDTTYGPTANGSLGMRIWIANPSDNVVCLHWQFVNNSGSRTATIQNNRAYYLQAKGNSKVYSLITRASMQGNVVLEVPAGFEGWLYIPYATTNFQNVNTDDGIFTKVRLIFPYADLNRDVELYTSRIDYYSDISFTAEAASSVDYSFDTMLPYTDANSVDVDTNRFVASAGSVTLDSTACEGEFGQSLKVTFDTNNDNNRVRFRIFNLCSDLASDSADGVSFWIKNSHNTDVKISIMVNDGNKNLTKNGLYYLKPDTKKPYTAYTVNSPTSFDNGERATITIPANFVGKVYLPYSLSNQMKNGVMDLYVCKTNDISTFILNFDSFRNYDFKELANTNDDTVPYWDYYTLQNYNNDHSESTSRGNWYNTDHRANFSDFSLEKCDFDGEELRALKLSVTAEESAKIGSLMFVEVVNRNLLDDANGMRFYVSNPSDTSAPIGITYCDNNAIYSCHKNGVYYLETKGNIYKAKPSIRWDSFYNGGANDVGIIEIPSGFSGYICVPFSSTTRASEKASFSRVRLFVGANSGTTQTLYLQSIDYYSSAVDFSNASSYDFGFDAFSAYPVSNATTSNYISLESSHKNRDGLSGKSIKANFAVNPSAEDGYVGWRIDALWGSVYSESGHGMRFWVKNPQDTDIEVRVQFGDVYRPCRINSAYYLRNKNSETVRYITSKASNENIGCITLPANFEGYVYLPYYLAHQYAVTTGHLILSPKVTNDITLYFDSFGAFNKTELNDVIWYESNTKIPVGPAISNSINYEKKMLDTARGQFLKFKNNNNFEIPILISDAPEYGYLVYGNGDVQETALIDGVAVIPESFVGKLYLPFAESQAELYSATVLNSSKSGNLIVETIGVCNNESYPLGDANDDGHFDITDLIHGKKHLVDKSVKVSKNGDVNGDLRQNSSDLQIVRIGLITDIVTAKNSYVPSDIIEPIDVAVYKPIYTDSELIIAEENVCDYGADSTGINDSTIAFKNAIFNASQRGGGTVYIPEGKYLITETITIPEGVTICGEWKNPDESPVGACGSIILARENVFLTSPVFELDTSTGIKGIAILYTQQNVASPIEYDFAVRVIGKRCYTLKDVTIIGAYNGIELGSSSSTKSCEVYDLKNVYISAINIGISNDATSDIGRMETVKIAPDYWCDNTIIPFSSSKKAEIREYMRNNAYGMKFYRNDWSIFYDVSVSYMKTGLYFGYEGEGYTGGFNGKFYNVNLYNCDTGIYLDKTKFNGADFTNLTVKTDIPATAGIDTGSAYVGTSMFYNTTVQGEFSYPVRDNGLTLNVSGYDGTLEFVSGTIGGYSGATYGVTVNSGSVTLENVYFSNPLNHVKLAEEIAAFVALGCKYKNNRSFSIPSTVTSKCKIDDTAVAFSSPETITLENKNCKPSSDIVVCVKDYGADPSLSDNTAAFTKAMNALANAGGGTLYVPAGNWRFEGELTVPSGVELRGSNVTQHMQNSEFRSGTILWSFGSSSENGTPFITLENSAGIRGFSVYYDGQVNASNRYPYTVKANGKNCYVVNVTLTNSYNGLDFASCDTSGYYIDGVMGCPVNTGISVGGSSKNGVLKNCQFNPNFSYVLSHNSGSISDRVGNGSAFKIGDISDSQLYGLVAYGYKNGFHFASNNTQSADNLTLLNCAIDGSETAVRFEKAQNVNIVNGQFVAMDGDNDRHCLITENGFTNTLKLYNSTLFGPTNYVLKLGGGNTEFHLVNLSSGTADYVIYMTKGNAIFNTVCFHNLNIIISGNGTKADFFGCLTRSNGLLVSPQGQGGATVTVRNNHWS